MGRPAGLPTISTPLVPALLRFARGRGASVAELCTRFGITEGFAASGAEETSLEPSALRPLFEAVAESCGEPWVGLRLAAERAVAGSLVRSERAVVASPTVRSALDALARALPLVHPLLRATWGVDGTQLTWVQTAWGAHGVGRHAEEYGLAYVVARCREIWPADTLRAREVSFSGSRPRDVGPLHRFFGTSELVFGADRVGFTLARSLLDVPLQPDAPTTPTRQRPDATSYPEPTSALAGSALRQMLADGPSLETVARRLAISQRTLQRRLERDGTTFLDLVDEVREQRARELLRDPSLTLAMIAEALGFADLATFSRAFKRWTGEPPGTFRRKGETRDLPPR